MAAQLTEESEALKEVLRIVLGFHQRDELEDLFHRGLFRKAIPNLEKALGITRARQQPDEFALALAIEMALLKEARDAGHDLEALFNDPDHHLPPSAEIISLVERLWSDKPQS
ncbi:MAG TPA: hypothetical protein VNE82_03350 [Candidatus Binataceae bacterium]|nr:hypothetical protein [Candidatus Binataceae bacterium]